MQLFASYSLPEILAMNSRPLPLWRIIAISVLCGLLLFVIVGFAISRPMTDFLVYWTAPHLFVNHGNPYSLTEVFATQTALGSRAGIPKMFLCPPWALTMLAPLGLMRSYELGWILWITALITSMAIGSKLFMDIYFAELEIPEISHPRWYRYLFACTFYPTLFGIKCTQTAPFLFLSLAGFLYYQRKNRRVAAALFLCITLLKPHLVLLVWLALLLNKEWKILGTSAVVTLALTAWALFRYPTAFQDYWHLMSGPYPHYTAGGVFAGLRAISGSPNTYWIQSIPTVLGFVWFVLYFRKMRSNWNWSDRLPVVVTASMLCAPYGFVYDQALLMIPITYLAAKSAQETGKISSGAIMLYSVLNAGVLALLFFSMFWAFLPGPILIAFWLARSSRTADGYRTESGAAVCLR